MPLTSTQKRWKRIVHEHAESGLAVNQFADQWGVNRSTLRWWLARFRSDLKAHAPNKSVLEVQPPVFVPIEIEPSRSEIPLLLNVDELGLRIEVVSSTDLHLLRQVLEALC